MRLFGIIGHPLGHSFSKRFFEQKFSQEGHDCAYQNFDIASIEEFPEVIAKNPSICGLNVTIPYKEAIIPFIDSISEEAQKIHAVNVIKKDKGKLIGYNTDTFGFEQILNPSLEKLQMPQALILGTGGASKAVQYVLKEKNIPFLMVSRTTSKGSITYQQIDNEIIHNHHLIINTTPLGMFPNNATFPEIPYHLLNKEHHLIDLVYNPEITTFLQFGREQGANIYTGLNMLYAQAEKAWEIWNK